MVRCDYCEEEFEIFPLEKQHKKGVVETYFVCPHCNHHYTSFVTDEKIRTMQQRAKRMFESLGVIGTTRSIDEYDATWKELKVFREEIRNRIRTLKEEVINEGEMESDGSKESK